MGSTCKSRILAALAILALTGIAAADGLEVGKPGGDFSLPGSGGTVTLRGLLDREDTHAVVVAITSYTCPYSLRAEPGLISLAAEYAEKGVRCVAIYPNRHETGEGMRQHAEKQGAAYPVLRDADAAVARAYGAEVTPTFFLFDKTGYLRYRGNLSGLGLAVHAVLAGEEVANPKTPAAGCTIKWPGEGVPDAPADAGPAADAPPPSEEGRPMPPPDRGPDRELSEAAVTWLGTLIDALGSDDPAVKRSAAQAILVLGPPAAPHVGRALQAAEGPRRREMERLLERLNAPPRQGGPGGGQRRAFGGGPGGSFLDMQRRAIEQNLDLTDEQKKAMEEAFGALKEREQELAGLRESGDREAFRDGVRELFQEAQAKLAEILTPEQLARWEELRRERGGRGAGGRRPGGERRPREDR